MRHGESVCADAASVRLRGVVNQQQYSQTRRSGKCLTRHTPRNQHRDTSCKRDGSAHGARNDSTVKSRLLKIAEEGVGGGLHRICPRPLGQHLPMRPELCQLGGAAAMNKGHQAFVHLRSPNQHCVLRMFGRDQTATRIVQAEFGPHTTLRDRCDITISTISVIIKS